MDALPTQNEAEQVALQLPLALAMSRVSLTVERCLALMAFVGPRRSQFLVPGTIPLVDAGMRHLKHWVFGPLQVFRGLSGSSFFRRFADAGFACRIDTSLFEIACHMRRRKLKHLKGQTQPAGTRRVICFRW